MDAVGQIGLRIRVLVHTGEIEILDEDVGGIGVYIAAAPPGLEHSHLDEAIHLLRAPRETVRSIDQAG